MNDSLSEAPKNPEIEKKPLRIIHIEDQEDFRNLIGSELKKFPADVELIASFAEAEEAERYLLRLSSEKQELPDGIVSDNNLGDGKTTGIKLAKDLRKQGFEIPVVLLTNDVQVFAGFSQEKLKQMGLAGVVDKGDFLRSAKDLIGIFRKINSPKT